MRGDRTFTPEEHVKLYVADESDYTQTCHVCRRNFDEGDRMVQFSYWDRHTTLCTECAEYIGRLVQ